MGARSPQLPTHSKWMIRRLEQGLKICFRMSRDVIVYNSLIVLDLHEIFARIDKKCILIETQDLAARGLRTLPSGISDLSTDEALQINTAES